MFCNARAVAADGSMLAFIVRKRELERICAHLGYPTEAPCAAPARGALVHFAEYDARYV